MYFSSKIFVVCQRLAALQPETQFPSGCFRILIILAKARRANQGGWGSYDCPVEQPGFPNMSSCVRDFLWNTGLERVLMTQSHFCLSALTTQRLHTWRHSLHPDGVGWGGAGVFRMGSSPSATQYPEIEEKTLDSPIQVPVAPWFGGLFCAGLQSCQ